MALERAMNELNKARDMLDSSTEFSGDLGDIDAFLAFRSAAGRSGADSAFERAYFRVFDNLKNEALSMVKKPDGGMELVGAERVLSEDTSEDSGQHKDKKRKTGEEGDGVDRGAVESESDEDDSAGIRPVWVDGVGHFKYAGNDVHLSRWSWYWFIQFSDLFSYGFLDPLTFTQGQHAPAYVLNYALNYLGNIVLSLLRAGFATYAFDFLHAALLLMDMEQAWVDTDDGGEQPELSMRKMGRVAASVARKLAKEKNTVLGGVRAVESLTKTMRRISKGQDIEIPAEWEKAEILFSKIKL